MQHAIKRRQSSGARSNIRWWWWWWWKTHFDSTQIPIQTTCHVSNLTIKSKDASATNQIYFFFSTNPLKKKHTHALHLSFNEFENIQINHIDLISHLKSTINLLRKPNIIRFSDHRGEQSSAAPKTLIICIYLLLAILSDWMEKSRWRKKILSFRDVASEKVKYTENFWAKI